MAPANEICMPPQQSLELLWGVGRYVRSRQRKVGRRQKMAYISETVQDRRPTAPPILRGLSPSPWSACDGAVLPKA